MFPYTSITKDHFKAIFTVRVVCTGRAKVAVRASGLIKYTAVPSQESADGHSFTRANLAHRKSGLKLAEVGPKVDHKPEPP